MKKLFYSLLALAMTAMTFTSCEDVPMPYDDPNSNTDKGGGEVVTPTEPSGNGTVVDPFNVAAAHNFITAGEGLDAEVYVKGKIVSIKEIDTGSYGNATYYISDDGTSTNQLEVYRGYGLNKAKFTSEDDIKIGDEVIVCGKLVNFGGNTHEFTQGNYIYSLNGQTAGGGEKPSAGEAKGSGTLEDPFNSVAANNEASKLGSNTVSDKEYYIKGKVVSIAVDKNGNVQNYDYGTFGNASFYISDDGSSNGQFYVYRALYFNKEKYPGTGPVLQVGDEVIICGKLTNYNGNTPETQQNEAYLYSLNGKTESGSGQETIDAGTYETPLTVTEAIAKATADEAWVKGYIVGYAGKVDGGTVASFPEGAKFTAEGCDIDTNILIAANASETNPANCMPVQLPKGDLRSGLNLKDNPSLIGKTVILKGQLAAYFNVPGIKAPTYAETDDKSFGTK